MKNTKQPARENKKEKLDPIVAMLLPESDKKMGAVASASLLVALLLCFWATTYEVLIDEDIFEKTPQMDITTTMNIIEKKEEKKVEPKEKPKPKQTVPSRRPGSGAKQSGRGNPRAAETRGVLKILTAQTNNAANSVYTLMNDKKFAHDIDKVIKNTNGLQVTGKTSITSRRGVVDAGFNEAIASGGSGGIANGLAGLMNGAGAISTKAIGKLTPPKPNEIDMGTGNSSRSASDIMKVVRQRTPGLRHIYNSHLKKNPGFQGKVTLSFTISPGGEVITIAIVSSTTGYAEFDNEVKKAVSRWTFSKVKSGNTTVTIPFTFSE